MDVEVIGHVSTFGMAFRDEIIEPSALKELVLKSLTGSKGKS